MFVENIQIYLASAVLAYLSLIDLRSHRIPNKILAGAVITHIIFISFSTHTFSHWPAFLGIGGVILIMFFPSNSIIFEKIGMGDFKLFFYILWIFGDYLNWNLWLIALAVFSVLVVIWNFLKSVDFERRIPFAPILALTTYSTLLV